MKLRTIKAGDVTAPAMNEEEIKKFLESKLNLQLATIDESGDPNIQPIWFQYEKDFEKFYAMTSKESSKVRNIRKKSNIYFSIDDEIYPYKGVKGKGTVNIIEDPSKVVPIAEKINLKYLDSLEHPVARMLMGYARDGKQILLEITPKFFST
jgi:nitroimidazol reductase NimA-like FMN-containing flavoprotein (pyridoxamine 5'-phosphate oxidase superfamily)